MFAAAETCLYYSVHDCQSRHRLLSSPYTSAQAAALLWKGKTRGRASEINDRSNTMSVLPGIAAFRYDNASHKRTFSCRAE